MGFINCCCFGGYFQFLCHHTTKPHGFCYIVTRSWFVWRISIPGGVPGIMHGICSTRLWSEVTWLLYSPLTSQLTPRCGLVAAGLGRTGGTRGLTGVSECWLVLSGPPCYRGCPRDLAGPQPEKYQLRSVWRQTDRQHRLALVTTYWSLSTLHWVYRLFREKISLPYTHM